MRSTIWAGSISFGLLNIGVSLRSAQEDKSIEFTMLDEKDLSPIHFKRVNSRTGKEVPYSRIVKGFKFKKNDYVVMSEADFKSANPKATQTLDIEDFIKIDEVDPMLYEKPYYLVPQKNNEKSYALLRDVLKKTGTVAIGKFVMHSKQHLAMLMARDEYLILEELRFSHEVKETQEAHYLDEVNLRKKYSSKEMAMAINLVKGMTSEWNPDKYQDTYYEDLMRIIHKKAKEGENYHVEKEEPEEKVASSNVADLLPLLRKSIESRTGKRKPSHSHRGELH